MSDTTATELLQSGAWRDVAVPAQVRQVPTMLHSDESKLLYALARHGYRGSGRIVDAGAFLGGSTAALAAGLRDGGRSGDRVIDVYDRFKVEGYTLAERWFAGTGLRRGDSFRPLFEGNLVGLDSMLAVHHSDIVLSKFESPIELLFIDVLKDWPLNDSLVPSAFSKLVPGAVVVQQDYWSGLLPWIHATMEQLADHFEVMADVGSSRVYILTNKLPVERLRIQRLDLAPTEWLRSFDRALVGTEGNHRGLLLVAKVQLLLLEFGYTPAMQLFEQVQRDYASYPEVVEAADRLASIYFSHVGTVLLKSYLFLRRHVGRRPAPTAFFRRMRAAIGIFDRFAARQHVLG